MGDKNTISSGLYAFVTLVKMAYKSPLFFASSASAKMLGSSKTFYICFSHSQAPCQRSAQELRFSPTLTCRTIQLSLPLRSTESEGWVGVKWKREREMWGYGMWGLPLTHSNLSKSSSPNKKQYLSESNLANSQVDTTANVRSFNYEILCERELNLLSQNMPLWHEDYFELKAIKTQQIQEQFFTSPPSPSPRHQITC